MPPRPDNAAQPMQLAAEANSTANRVREDFAEYRRAQAETNQAVRDEIGRLAGEVHDVGNDLAGLRGELNGQAKSTRGGLALVGVIVSVVSVGAALLPHFLGPR